MGGILIDIGGFSFNRDIVECKVSLAIAVDGEPLRFNRDIVECKEKRSVNGRKGDQTF